MFWSKKDTEERNYQLIIDSMFKASGVFIDESIIEKIPLLKECINLISNQVAQLPIHVHKRDTSKAIECLNDYREYVLNNEPNEFSNGYAFKYDLVKDYLLYGVSYHLIEREGLNIKSFTRVNPKSVNLKKYLDSNGRVVDIDVEYTLNNKRCTTNIYNFFIVSNSSDFNSKGILNSSEFLKLIAEQNKLLQTAITNMAHPSGILHSKSRLTREVIDRLRESWSNLYNGTSNAGKTVILEEGLEYKQIKIDLSGFSLNDNKEHFDNDIKSLFGLNIIDVSDHYQFATKVIAPITVAIESALDKQLLKESEKTQGYYFEFDIKELERGSISMKADTATKLLKAGVFSLDEARRFVNTDDWFGGASDRLMLDLGTVMLSKDGNLTVANLGSTTDINNNKSI